MKENIWTKRVLVPAASATASLLLVAGVAMANTTASNSDTGSDSTNNATVSVDNDITINSTNNANISNNITINANTGNNSASQNTGDGSVSTGNINGSVSITNTGNQNGVFDSKVNWGCAGNCNFSSSNKNTGSGSTNNSSVNVDTDVNININFDIEIINDLNRNVIGSPLPSQPPAGPAPEMPKVTPGPRPGQVLAAQAGLPITGGNLPLWPVLLVMVGIALKIFDKTFKVRFVK